MNALHFETNLSVQLISGGSRILQERALFFEGRGGHQQKSFFKALPRQHKFIFRSFLLGKIETFFMKGETIALPFGPN
jgi:hypothetical protein